MPVCNELKEAGLLGEEEKSLLSRKLGAAPRAFEERYGGGHGLSGDVTSSRKRDQAA